MPQRPTNDGRRQVHDDFFARHSAEGGLHQPDGQRTVAASLRLLEDLRLALVQEFGDSARHLAYCTGFDWSLRTMVRLRQRVRDQSAVGGGPDFWQADTLSVLEVWWESLAIAGWGECRFEGLSPGLVLADVRASAPAAALGRATAPGCHFTTGLVAGACSFCDRTERHAVEIQCAALGHASCQFIAGAPPHIRTIEAWRQQNLPADEIRRRLASLPDAAA